MTSSARNLLLHQSIDHLLTARYAVEAAFDDELGQRLGPDQGLDLGMSFFRAINDVLKLSIDLDDGETFAKVERKWASLFDDVWLPSFPSEGLAEGWSERRGGVPRPELILLLRRREVLRFGLVMWISHLLDRPLATDRAQHLGESFGRLASRFGGVEWILDAHDAAANDERSGLPWTGWFLQELPDDEAHSIPTSEKLLRAALLLCTRGISSADPAELRPRDWYLWRKDEIAQEIDRLHEQRERWQRLLGVTGPFAPQPEGTIADPETSWTARMERLKALFEQGARAQRTEERIAVRNSPLDPTRVGELRDRTLNESSSARLIRDTIERHASIVSLREPPEDHEALAARTWMPRQYFTVDSRVVGLDMLARDLARPMRDAERQQLSAALPDVEIDKHEGETIAEALRRTITEMRADGLRPTLMILPLNWRLQREIGLSELGAMEVRHELVPLAHRRDFCGVFDDVLALDLVGMPDDVIWVLDLSVAVRFEEWPSDNQSGIQFELLSFDDAAAAEAFIKSHPEVAGSASLEAAIENVQERVLITLRLCWRILSNTARGARAVAVPASLQREE